MGKRTDQTQDASATTYSINCPPGTDSNDCGMGSGMTVIAADETTTYIMNDGDNLYDLIFFPSFPSLLYYGSQGLILSQQIHS